MVSGTFWTGSSLRILDLIDSKEIELVISEKLIEEYNNTINSEEIMDKSEKKNLIINNIVQEVLKNSTIVKPLKKLDIIKEDPDDNKVLECAIEGNVSYIITKDNHLLKLKEFRGVKNNYSRGIFRDLL